VLGHGAQNRLSHVTDVFADGDALADVEEKQEFFGVARRRPWGALIHGDVPTFL
jgi:hypothetical protein